MRTNSVLTKTGTKLLVKSQTTNQSRINSEYSLWEVILFGVSQGSTLLFNIFLCNFFFITDDIDFANYANNNTPCTLGNDMKDVIFKLKICRKYIFNG